MTNRSKDWFLQAEQDLNQAKGSLKDNLADLAPRFRSDLAVSIEQNQRNNSIISWILRLRNGRKWPEDGMRKCEVIFERALSFKNGGTS
jgi:hypothetical protein